MIESNRTLQLQVLAFAALAAMVWQGSAAAADVDELVVSVRKTDENVQDVPIQVSSLSDSIIKSEAVRNIGDVAELIPSLQFDTGFWPSDTRVSIRGLFNRAGRPSAAILIDGVDAVGEAFESTGGSALVSQRLLDIQRIEVARGPQSALYGRAAFSGAVNYVTRRPPEEWEAVVSGEGAEGGRAELRGTFGGPVTDTLRVNVVASRYELDGDYRNPNTGGYLGGGESEGVGFSLEWTPSDSFSAYWNTTYSNDEFAPPAIAFVPANTFRILLGDGTLIPNGMPSPINDPTTAGCTMPPLGGNDSCLWVLTGPVKANESMINVSPDPRNGREYPGTDDETLRSTLILDWDLSDAVAFRSATSFTRSDQELNMDTTQTAALPGNPGNPPSYGSTAGNGSDAKNDFKFDQVYQEFQLSGEVGQHSWLAGLNYWQEDAEDRNTSRFWYRDPNYYLCDGSLPFNPAGGKSAPCSFGEATRFNKTITRDTESYSLFGLFGWAFAEDWKLTLEGRLIRDDVKISTNTADQGGDALAFAFGSAANSYIYQGKPGFTDMLDDTNFLPRVTLEHNSSDAVMWYGSVAKGIKPPTFNTTDLSEPIIARVNKETLWTYELGAKSTLDDGRLLLNGALFLNDYEDQQVRVQFPANPGSFLPRSGTANAGEVTIWGLEIDANWRPDDFWMFNASYAYTDGEFDDLVLATAQPPTAPISRTEQVKAGNAIADFSGNDTPGNPDHAASLLGRYQAPFRDDIEWFAQGVLTYQGERWADTANLVELESYFLANAQVGLETERWNVTLFVDNLFDDDTVRYAQEFIDQSQGFQGTDPSNSVIETFTYPVAYYAYLPQPRTLGVRFSYQIR